MKIKGKKATMIVIFAKLYDSSLYAGKHGSRKSIDPHFFESESSNVV